MNDKRLIFVYEPEQVADAVEYIRVRPATIIAMDHWAECELTRMNVPFESARASLPSAREADQLFEWAQTIAREWYRIPEMAFFEHRGIHLAEALESNFDDYLQYVTFCAHVVDKVLKSHPGITCVVMPYSRATGMRAPLSPFQYNCPVDIASTLSSRYGFVMETLGKPTNNAVALRSEPQPILHRFALFALNTFALFLPRKRRKLLASEDWDHIRSFMDEMDDTELVLTDKSELRKMSWRSLFRHRVRFLRPADVAPRAAYAIAEERMDSFRNAWSEARGAVGKLSCMQSDGYSLWPIVEKAFDLMVQIYPERVIVDIEGTVEILRREKIDTVLLRASVSGQYHFFVTAHIAHSLGIPSIEIQHAGAVLDPRSVHSRLEASYLAAFGPLTCKEYAKRYDEQRLRPIGAPRFDSYFSTKRPDTAERARRLRTLGLDPSRPVVLVVVPKENLRLWLAPWHPTSYDVAAQVDAFAALRTELPEIQYIFKFRKNGCSEYHRAYLREHFPQGSFVISDDDLFSMILISDCVVSGNSTALYESMIAGKPLVLYFWKPDAYHEPVYGRIGPIAQTAEAMIVELKKVIRDPGYGQTCLQRQKKFMDENYSFDGQAWKRMALFLESELIPFPTTE